MFGFGIPACERVNQIAEMKNMTGIMISTIEETILISANKDADHFLKYHTYLSVLHGLVSIQMMRKDGHPTEENRRVLQDAVSGFIKSLLI